MSGPRIALLVTHLMGSGHLVRVLAIARALAERGAAPLVISGGRPLAHLDAHGVEVAQLPPLASNGLDYRTLLRADGARAGEADLAARRDALAALIRARAPDALVTELHPFGRRILAAEFDAAIAAMPAGAPIIASIRDVLEPPSKPKRVAQTLERLAPFAAVLVHGDPAVIGLEASWPGGGAPLPDAARPLIRHTGYVTTPAPPAAPLTGEVLAAVGGGAIGRRLLETAARASALSSRPWRLRVGGADAEAAAAALRRLGPAVVEPAAADYRARLSGAAVSVSLAGYNTAVEVEMSGAPALLVPMEEGGEQEQLIRAEALARLPGIEMTRIGALTPERLVDAVEQLAARGRRASVLRAEGGAEAARVILRLVEDGSGGR